MPAWLAPLAAIALVGVAALGTTAAGAAGPSAKTARTLNLNDSASLKLNNHKGVELKESGTAHGNLPGSIFIQLRLASARSVTAKIQVYPSGGSVSASASATYRVVTSSSASFSGRLNITGGSGRYSKAKGSGLSFTGTVHRPSDSVSVHVSGKMSY
ncbi:MAG TPA: hypothetical protein VFW38_10110 [Solirubrobacteraceae bacterium]|nr:hypothetical protein [Solirubrobacteraceae bacterium]